MTQLPDHLPPSATLVYRVLSEHPEQEFTRKQIEEEAQMKGRTARYAIKRLREEGVVKEIGPSWTDLSKPCYRLAGNYRQRAEA